MRTFVQILFTVIVLTPQMHAAGAPVPAVPLPPKLELHAMTGGKTICVGTSAQFLDSTTLVALVGASAECYRDLNQVELISFFTNGSVVARMQWSSTFAFAVIPNARLIVNAADEILVLNASLETVQSISLASIQHLSVQFGVASPPTVAAYPGYARPPRTFRLTGDPVEMTEILSPSGQVATLGNGDAVIWNRTELARKHEATTVRAYDISWLTSCNSLCHAWTGVRLVSVVSNASGSTALFVAKGSKVPLTDSGGLFPFTRILAISLDSGVVLFQQEFLTDTTERSAALDPVSRLVAVSDKRHLTFYRLQEQPR